MNNDNNNNGNEGSNGKKRSLIVRLPSDPDLREEIMKKIRTICSPDQINIMTVEKYVVNRRVQIDNE